MNRLRVHKNWSFKESNDGVNTYIVGIWFMLEVDVSMWTPHQLLWGRDKQRNSEYRMSIWGSAKVTWERFMTGFSGTYSHISVCIRFKMMF